MNQFSDSALTIETQENSEEKSDFLNTNNNTKQLTEIGRYEKENIYLLNMKYNTQQISEKLGIDECVLNNLDIEQNLCIPIKNINELSKQFQEDIRKNITQIQVESYEKKQQFDNESVDIKDYLKDIKDNDVSDQDKINYFQEINEILVEHKERCKELKKLLNAEQISKFNEDLNINLQSITHFNHKAQSRQKKIQLELQTLEEELNKFVNQNEEIMKNEKNVVISKEIDLNKNVNEQKKLQMAKEKTQEKNDVEQQKYDNTLISLQNNIKQQEKLMNEKFIKDNKIKDDLAKIQLQEKEFNSNQSKKLFELSSQLKTAEQKKNQYIDKQNDYSKYYIQKIFSMIYKTEELNKLEQYLETNKNDQQIFQSKKNEYDECQKQLEKEINELKQREKNLKKELDSQNNNQNSNVSFQEQLIKSQEQIKQYQIDLENTKQEMKTTQEQIDEKLREINNLNEKIKDMKLDYDIGVEKNRKKTEELKQEQEILPQLIFPSQFLQRIGEQLHHLQDIYNEYSDIETALDSNQSRVEKSFDKYLKSQNDYESQKSKSDTESQKSKLSIFLKSIRNLSSALQQGYEERHQRSVNLYQKSQSSSQKIQTTHQMYYQIKKE